MPFTLKGLKAKFSARVAPYPVTKTHARFLNKDVKLTDALPAVRYFPYRANNDNTETNCVLKFLKTPPSFKVSSTHGNAHTWQIPIINCGHWAILDSLLRKNKQGPMRTERPRVFSDLKKIEELLPNPNKVYQVICQLEQNAPTRHWLSPQEPSNFFAAQLYNLKIPDPGKSVARVFLISTGTHCLNLTFKVKNKEGNLEYSISYYDPNLTHDHFKVRLSEPDDAAGMSIGNFVPAEAIKYYSSYASAYEKNLERFMPFNIWALFPLTPSLDRMLDMCEDTSPRTIIRWDKSSPDGDNRAIPKREFDAWLARINTTVK